jgi:hypothetical protein
MISLEASNVPAIIITAVAAPANNLDKPNTEKNAAEPEIDKADMVIRNGSNFFILARSDAISYKL